MSDLVNHVAAHAPHKCKDIALQLGISQGEVDSIFSPNIGSTSNYYSTVFASWKRQKRKQYTWGYLIRVLRLPAVGCIDLAEDLLAKPNFIEGTHISILAECVCVCICVHVHEPERSGSAVIELQL